MNTGLTVTNGAYSENRRSVNSLFRTTVLRTTLPGEYLSLFLMCHSLFGAACWTTHFQNPPAAIIMISAGFWTAFRAVGGLAGNRWASSITFLLLLFTIVLSITGVSGVPSWLGSSLVGPIIWSGMLMVILVVEFFDCRVRRHAVLNVPERRKRDGTSLKLLFAGLIVAWGLGVPTGTWIHQLNLPSTGAVQAEKMGFAEHVGFRCGEALVTVCFFVLGCNIGSFLNVVVWRTPLGRSVVYEKSRCPVCASAIAGTDNIPIFGWFGLGGQCRACRAEISSRYPIVEGITGCLFLLLYFTELISGGANLPTREINMYRGVLWILMYPKWDLIRLYFLHCYFFCVLGAMILMARDRNRVPVRFLVFTISAAAIFLVLLPDLALIPVWPTITATPTAHAVLHVVVGAVVGIAAGMILNLVEGKRRNCQESAGSDSVTTSSFCLIGIVLGWQAVCSVLMLVVCLSIVRYLLNIRGTGIFCDLPAAVLLHHITWRGQWHWWSS